jgi:hypothetical protein
VSIAVRVGGNFVYVVNKGTGKGDGNVAVFAVGEDGILTFQETYSTAGNTPVWAARGRDGQLSLRTGFAGAGLCDDGQRGHHRLRDRRQHGPAATGAEPVDQERRRGSS